MLLLVPPALRNFVKVLTQIEAVDHSDGLYGILSTKEGPGPMYLVQNFKIHVVCVMPMQVNAAPIPPKDTAAKVQVTNLPNQLEGTEVRAIAASPEAKNQSTVDAAGILRQGYGQPTVEIRSSASVAPLAVATTASTAHTVENTMAAIAVPPNSTLPTTIDESLLEAMGKTIARVKSVVVADTTDRTAAAGRVLEVLQLVRGYAEARARLPFIFEGDTFHNEFMNRLQIEIDASFIPINGVSSSHPPQGDAGGRIHSQLQGERSMHQNMQVEDRNSSHRAAGRQLPRSSGSRK